MTDCETTAFQKRTEKSKLTQNAFAIKCLLNHPINVIEGIAELTRQLKGIGNNLNQLAKAANSGQAMPLVVTELEEGVGQLWRLLRQLKVEKI